MTNPSGSPAIRYQLSPFLHHGDDRIYAPLTDRTLQRGDAGYDLVVAAREGAEIATLGPAEWLAVLADEGWLVPVGEEISRRFYLKYVSLEASSVCNQGCYFCPVSVARRADEFMSMELYERIVEQLAAYRDTLEGVSMINYNEPTADKRFLDQVRILKRYGLPPAVSTNGTGLTPERTDAILEMGGIYYLSVNLSTLDRERYKVERGGDHLPLVLRNLDHVKDKPFAPRMEMVVLGTGDERHRRDFAEIQERFRGSRFRVLYYEVMDRAGVMPIGLHPPRRGERLRGCEQTGSRPLQWVHVNSAGQCILCCQDYHHRYVVGDLNHERLDDILSGERMALLRRWVYGIEEAPDDFICRGCIYALRR